jgi:hypothetical protein
MNKFEFRLMKLMPDVKGLSARGLNHPACMAMGERMTMMTNILLTLAIAINEPS